MPGMPQPNEQHHKLHALAGRWVGEERLEPSRFGPGGTAVGRFSMYVGIDGFFVVQDYLKEKDERVVYRGHGIFGWDEGEQCYALYWVDSLGAVPLAPSRGQWHGDTLRFEHAPVGDQRGRYTYTFVGADGFRFQIENSEDAGKTWRTFMTGEYRRA